MMPQLESKRRDLTIPIPSITSPRNAQAMLVNQKWKGMNMKELDIDSQQKLSNPHVESKMNKNNKKNS